MTIGFYVLAAIVVCALILVKKSLVIIPQSETKIIERLGKYYATLKPGINIIIPFIDRAKPIITMSRGRYMYATSIDLREQVYDFDKQNVITKDNVQTQINALLYFQIVDPFKAVYEISNLPNAIEKLTQTTLRNIIGELELDQTLTSRDTINTKLRAVLDDATNKWGIKVNRVDHTSRKRTASHGKADAGRKKQTCHNPYKRRTKGSSNPQIGGREDSHHKQGRSRQTDGNT